MQTMSDDEREAIARIIDPFAIDFHDSNPAAWKGRCDTARWKADAILNFLRTKEPSRG